MDNTYNGWTNYETWCVSRWLNNDEPLYDMVMEIVGTVAPDMLARSIRDMVEDMNPLATVGMYSDLIGYSLQKVNWDEIARLFAE